MIGAALSSLSSGDAERLGRKLHAYFCRRGCLDCDDLVQETLIRAWRALSKDGKENYGANPDSFFYGIARNVAYEHWRNRRRHPVEELNDAQPAHCGSPGTVAQIEQKTLLGQCLDALSEDERTLLIDYYAVGPDALRERLQVSAGALRLRVHRVLKKLRGSITGPPGGEPL